MRCIKLVMVGVIVSLLSACGTANVFVKPGTRVDTKIAVMTPNLKFQNHTDLAESEVFADSLSMQFMKAGFDVIERAQIDKIRAEHNLAKEGLLSQDDAVQVGKIMNIKYIVTSNGVLTKTNSDLFVLTASVKFVNVNTGQTDISGTLKGYGVRTIGAAERIGDDLVRAINEHK